MAPTSIMTPKKKRTMIFWMLFLVFGIVLLGTVAITGFMYFKQETASRFTPSFWVLNSKYYNVTELKNSPNLLTLGVGYSAFDPTKGLKVELGFQPKNNLSTAGFTPKLPVCVSHGDEDLEFEAFEEMGTSSFSVSFSGDPSWFPFDKYKGELFINAYTGTATSNGTCENPLPISPAVLGSVQGFVITSDVTPGFDENDPGSKDYSTALIKFTATRTKVAIGFSILIFIVMWLLSLIVCLIAFVVWKSGRRTELGLCTVSSGLLFALPRIRDTQPGIPKMGIMADMVGYIWNVLLVAICLISLLTNYIIKRHVKKWDDKTGNKEPEDNTAMMAMPDMGPMDSYDDVDDDTLADECGGGGGHR